MRQTLIKAHVPFPEFNAVFVSTVEFVCGLFLVLGAVTPLASALLAGVIVVAIATHSDSEYQSNFASRVARGISVSS